MPNIPELDDIRRQIIDRHQLVDWPTHYPWWPRPPVVKILFFADGGIQYDGGSFLGLKQVLATLSVQHHPWVRFDVTTVNRIGDPSADYDNLDLAAALALDSFDELWIYSYDSNPQLSPAELAAAATFMDDHNGGVLITGDHDDLGAAFANLPRAGKMRDPMAPDLSPVSLANDTLRSGADATFEFNDQSDATPQPLTLRRYWAGWLWRAPHPVLCSRYGPIDIFPDHEHEGEALAPAPSPASEWPGGVGAEVIAWGTIVDSRSATPGRRFGVLSAYEGHPQGVGRILADSTWHHHFDINLRGLPGNPDRSGFVTPGTGDWLTQARKIEHFFVNAAVWLAPPARQAQMRAAAWWAALFSDTVVEARSAIELSPVLGRAAVDALGRYAPACAVFHWIWSLVPISLQREIPVFIDKGDPPPILEIVAGVATRQLLERLDAGRPGVPVEPPDLDKVAEAFDGVAREATAELVRHIEQNLEQVTGWARLAADQ